MNLTVAETLYYPEFTGFRLIAGAGGISNQITSVSILDYEFDGKLKSKYSKLSFAPNQMILTSLQYAKNDPGCLTEAIRLLANKKCSCLAIKNVYALQIPAQALHFADSSNFPVLLIENPEQTFERIIVNTHKRIDSLYDFDKYENLVSAVLSVPDCSPRLGELEREINPCLQSDKVCLYFRALDVLTKDDFMAMDCALKNAGRLSCYNSLLRYKNGLLYIHTSKNFRTADVMKYTDTLIKGPLVHLADRYEIGVSSIHYKKYELKACIREAVYASFLNYTDNERYKAYDDLGVARILLPYCRDNSMQLFSESVLAPLRDYDAANNSLLVKTAGTYVREGGNIAATAIRLGTHANTIRYRLQLAGRLTGINLTTPEGYESLSLAIKIEACSRIEL